MISRSKIYVIFRIALGGLFVFASWNKILDPHGFAEIVRNYKILPPMFVNPVALLLPWTEMVCGVMLISGFLVKGSVLVIDIMMMIFTLALLFNVYRGLDVSCGCFSLSLQTQKGMYLYYILRDIVLLAMGIWILVYRLNKDRKPDSAREKKMVIEAS